MVDLEALEEEEVDLTLGLHAVTPKTLTTPIVTTTTLWTASLHPLVIANSYNTTNMTPKTILPKAIVKTTSSKNESDWTSSTLNIHSHTNRPISSVHVQERMRLLIVLPSETFNFKIAPFVVTLHISSAFDSGQYQWAPLSMPLLYLPIKLNSMMKTLCHWRHPLLPPRWVTMLNTPSRQPSQ